MNIKQIRQKEPVIVKFLNHGLSYNTKTIIYENIKGYNN